MKDETIMVRRWTADGISEKNPFRQENPPVDDLK